LCRLSKFRVLTLRTVSGIGIPMKSLDEQILRAAKEIIVKFIEMGRLSPSNFQESFKDIYTTINETVKNSVKQDDDHQV
jgi:hypothetical protein